MTLSVCGRYGLWNGEKFSPLETVYKTNRQDCAHEICVYVRSVTKNGQDQVYAACVRCGDYVSQCLKLADHPDRKSYPTICDHYIRDLSGYARYGIRARQKTHSIHYTDRSGGGEFEPSHSLWMRDDIRWGTAIINEWNSVMDSLLEHEIPRERARAMQFGLTEIWCHDGILDIDISVAFDPDKYANVIANRFADRNFPVSEINFSTDVPDHYTRFGDGFRYADYIASAQWQERRECAIDWNPNMRSSAAGMPSCESPLCDGIGYKVECHHLTYQRAGHEQPGDLVFLCSRCHRNFEFVKSVTPPRIVYA